MSGDTAIRFSMSFSWRRLTFFSRRCRRRARSLTHQPGLRLHPMSNFQSESMADDVKSEDPAYPNDLKAIEETLLCKRRGLSSGDQLKNKVGFGLSGGGIRSATFCLGLFQGLAKQHLLSKIDYMSTVSGGGYFGAFYGRLFTRKQITGIADVEDAL